MRRWIWVVAAAFVLVGCGNDSEAGEESQGVDVGTVWEDYKQAVIDRDSVSFDEVLDQDAARSHRGYYIDYCAVRCPASIDGPATPEVRKLAVSDDERLVLAIITDDFGFEGLVEGSSSHVVFVDRSQGQFGLVALVEPGSRLDDLEGGSLLNEQQSELVEQYGVLRAEVLTTGQLPASPGFEQTSAIERLEQLAPQEAQPIAQTFTHEHDHQGIEVAGIQARTDAWTLECGTGTVLNRTYRIDGEPFEPGLMTFPDATEEDVRAVETTSELTSCVLQTADELPEVVASANLDYRSSVEV